MRWTSHHHRGPAALAVLVALTVVISLVALGPHLGFTATPSHLWTEQPLAVSQPTTSAPAWLELAKALKPAVVNISTRVKQKAPDFPEMLDENKPFNDFFRQFRGRPAPRVLHGLGSGFIISPSGDIVTNNHVVDGATEIKITMSDGREFTANVLGRDP